MPRASEEAQPLFLSLSREREREKERESATSPIQCEHASFLIPHRLVPRLGNVAQRPCSPPSYFETTLMIVNWINHMQVLIGMCFVLSYNVQYIVRTYP